MIRIEAIVGQGDIGAISNSLKKIHVGGITIMKVRGRGKNLNPQIHAAKGTEMFTPEFSDKFIIQIIVMEQYENDVISIIRNNAKIGKIFVSTINRAVDIASGNENEKAI
ncbi:MAG: P-II family nitrogen regulator [Nitrosotalea sp.]